MARNLLRVRDIFLQFDDDDNGRIDVEEFRQAMYQMGFDGLDDALVAVFKSFDEDGSKSIDFREMHNLLLRSARSHPHLPPLAVKAENAIRLRKARVQKKNANLMQGLSLDADTEEDVPDKLRQWMHKNLLRVRDVFAQLDDDGNGRCDKTEFRKALRELGCHAPTAALDALFRSFDADGSKAIEYRELHNLLVRSVQAHPHLPPLPAKAENAVAVRRRRLERSDSNMLQGLVIDEHDMDAAIK